MNPNVCVKESEHTDLDLMRDMFRSMLRIRRLEEKVAGCVETGEVRTPCHLCIGQEAIAVGVCSALQRSDTVWGTHRSHGHYLAKGGCMRALTAEIFARANGCSSGRGGSMHLFQPHVGILGTVPIVGGTVPLAVGAGLASHLSRSGAVSVAFFGDGTLEEGHVLESMNLAALYRLPVVFVCENNAYASHLHLSERRLGSELTRISEPFSVPASQVDGNDVLAVLAAATAAVHRARSGGGPTFLECLTFRWRGHVGASWDMDVGVLRRDELQHWLPKDPVERARKVLLSAGVSEEDLRGIAESAELEVDDSLDYARRSPGPSATDATLHVFAESKESGCAN